MILLLNTKNNIGNTLSDIIGKINNEGIKQFFYFIGHGTNVHDYSSMKMIEKMK